MECGLTDTQGRQNTFIYCKLVDWFDGWCSAIQMTGIVLQGNTAAVDLQIREHRRRGA